MAEILDIVAAWSWVAYLIIFGVLLVESAGAPIPALTVALVGAALAGQGKLEIWLVVLANISGGIIGGQLGYIIGKQGGRQLIERYGRYALITPERLAMSEAAFQKHGSKAVLLGRYIPFLCFSAGILSGIARLPIRQFFVYNALSIMLWSCSHLTIGYIFGSNLELLGKIINNIGMAIVVAIGLFVAVIAYRFWRNRKPVISDKPKLS